MRRGTHFITSNTGRTFNVTRTKSWSVYAPHVYFINLEKSISRNFKTQKMLQDFGYSYTRINAITPKAIIPKGNPSCGVSLNCFVVFSCTLSHLESIYTAVRDYKSSNFKRTKKLSYAFIMEDDGNFMFDVCDWKGLIASAPANWSILQISTSNAEYQKTSYDQSWVKYREQWQRRTNRHVWGTMAYLINMDSPMILNLFGNASSDEKALFNARFNHTKLFRSSCDNSDASMSSRLGCKAFGNNNLYPSIAGYDVEDVDFPADYFIYHLGNPNTYVSTIPLLNFELNQESTIHQDNESVWIGITRSVAETAVKNKNLPNYLNSNYSKLSHNFSAFENFKESSVIRPGSKRLLTNHSAVRYHERKISPISYILYPLHLVLNSIKAFLSVMDGWVS